MPQDPEHDHEDLNEATAEELDRLVRSGTQKLETGDTDGALADFEAGIALLPEPKHHWVASTWLYASVGNIHFDGHRWQPARDNFAAALESPSGVGNPFIQLRLGQAEFELGNTDQALHRLLFARLRGPADLMAEEDPKYSAFLDQAAR